jgi:thioredoxin-dependent peroxiredoxin
MRKVRYWFVSSLLGLLGIAAGNAGPAPRAVAAAAAEAAPAPGPLAPGSAAPDFTLPATGGGPVTLSGLRGRTVVLYFYPKDETPGCTREACDFRDRFGELRQAGVVVLGISTQSLASHGRFTVKEHLPFPLLADPAGRVAALYGVPVHSLPGLGRFTERVTFVIDHSGQIVRTWPKVSVTGHVEEVLQFVRAPGAAQEARRDPRPARAR